MKYFYVLLFIFCISFAAACRPAAAPVSISNTPLSSNDLPPTKPVEQMTWTKFDGKTNVDGGLDTLGDLQGKAVILDFWATYCPPCIEGIPHLRSLQAKYGKDNLEVVGLHVGGEDDRAKVPSFVEKLQIDYTLATPENELTRFIFGRESAIPQTAVFDRKGRLVEKFVGFNEKIKKDLDAAVEKAINSEK